MKVLSIYLFVFFSIFAHAETVLITDQDYSPALLKELSNAQTNIDILSFSFAIDDGKGQIQLNNQAFIIAKKLADLKKSKGKIFQIRHFIEGERSTVDRNKISADYLEKAGIIIKYGSTHAKGFSIDHRKILFGSTNLTSQSMMKNNETNILSDDPLIIKGFDQFFENLWNDGKEDSINLDGPMLADGIYKSSILKAINSATKSLDFSIYYFNDSDIENALIQAFKRGVHVRGYLNQHKIPGSDLVEKNIQTVKRMREAGMNDLHFNLDNSFNHSKYIICDKNQIFLGTGNWNDSDVKNYRQLYVHLIDSRMALELSAHLDEQVRLKSDPSK